MKNFINQKDGIYNMVEFSKIQKFLKNKHKFDAKIDGATIFDVSGNGFTGSILLNGIDEWDGGWVSGIL